MLTPLQGDRSTNPTSPREGKMPQLLDRTQLLSDPLGAHALVLRLICDLARLHGEPVEHEVLQWYTDMEPRTGDATESLDALDKVLGPRPRRINLLTVLGDLVDLGVVRQEPEGLYTTPEGVEILKDLDGQTASFERAIA